MSAVAREGFGTPLSEDEQRLVRRARRTLAPLPEGYVDVQLSVGQCHATVEVLVQRNGPIVSVLYRDMQLAELFTDAQLNALAELVP